MRFVRKSIVIQYKFQLIVAVILEAETSNLVIPVIYFRSHDKLIYTTSLNRLGHLRFSHTFDFRIIKIKISIRIFKLWSKFNLQIYNTNAGCRLATSPINNGLIIF